MTSEIPEAYEPKAVEDKWYADWLEKGCFTANPASAKPPSAGDRVVPLVAEVILDLGKRLAIGEQFSHDYSASVIGHDVARLHSTFSRRKHVTAILHLPNGWGIMV
jgi:hypothetical protein